MIFQRVCIIGVGLLGGSIGLALHRKRLAKQVIGVGRTTSRLDVAIRRGAIDEATDDILVGAKDADLVIACVPIQSIVESLDIASKVARPDGCWEHQADDRQGCPREAFGPSILGKSSDSRRTSQRSRACNRYSIGQCVGGFDPNGVDLPRACLTHVPVLGSDGLEDHFARCRIARSGIGTF